MKKPISVVILIFALSISGWCGRVITSFDIARWYLDSDLVLICNAEHTDTITITKFDSLVEDGYHLHYDIIREKYKISIDSIIKGEPFEDKTMDTIFTPDFPTMAFREKEVFAAIGSNGDSIFIRYIETFIPCCNDGDYFTIGSPEKRLVILQKTETGYVIDYETKCDSSILALIQEVKLRGEDYFGLYESNESVKTNENSVYPNPFSNILNLKGINAKRIEITDLYGKIVRTEKQVPQSMDLSDLSPGTYIISIITDHEKWCQKIIKR